MVKHMTHDPHSELSMDEKYIAQAVYFLDSDCVEYVKEDTLNIYDRVDDFLTLVWDETRLTLIGFKLKGFKYFFDAHLKPLYKLNDEQFINLVSAIEAHFTEVGNEIFASGNRARADAYKAALKLAANDNVRLSGAMFRMAA
jgi:hypothetical protein